ncbi:serine hydrolase [bacterium]|nr:serine hydrolase [bacterium]
MRNRLIAWLLTLVMLCPLVGWAQPEPFDPQSMQQVMEALVSSKVTPSVSVAVVHKGQVVFVRALGSADQERQVAATARTPYRIGSTTKMFTALAVMQLVEQGKLSLDDTLSSFQSDFPNASQISVKQLLQHRSGIPNYLDQALSDGRALQPTTPQEIVASVAKLASLSPPGSKYSYSNTNYVLLGLMVEKLAGMPLHQYFASKLFQPAGLKETGTEVSAQSPALAVGYQGTSPQNPGHLSWYYACGDLSSTAEDLARFDVALMDGQIVKPATLAMMQAQALPTGAGLSLYGLGLQVNPIGDLTLAGHHGGVPGFEADDEMVLQDRFAVIALGNDFNFPTSRILSVALAGCYPQQMRQLQALQVQHAAARLEREQPRLTARFTVFTQSLLTGAPGELPGDLTEALKAGLNPSVVQVLRATYADLGQFESLQFVDDDEVAGLARYHYVAVFSQGKKPMTFLLDAQNKLAGFQTQ